MDVRPVVLEGDRLRLEPLTEEHAEGLWRHASDEVFLYIHGWWETGTLERFHNHVREVLARPGFVTFAMVDKATEMAVGSSAYMEIRPDHRGLEIGSTWIGKAYQAGWVNPEAKLLMLRHAFENLGCIRVQLKTDARNLQSRAAIQKLGAKPEGVLRKHMVCRDGFLRDTAIYSITDEEWPQVEAGLVARLDSLKASA